MNEGIKKK